MFELPKRGLEQAQSNHGGSVTAMHVYPYAHLAMCNKKTNHDSSIAIDIYHTCIHHLPIHKNYNIYMVKVIRIDGGVYKDALRK